MASRTKRSRSTGSAPRDRASDGSEEVVEEVEGQIDHNDRLPRPTKRTRQSSPLAAAAVGFTLEGSLSEEVLLRILSFLPVEDLMVISRVSSAWHRLAQDPQLWRSLYLSTFASSASPMTVPTRTRPWRDLYKISTNWRRGNARPSTLGQTMRKSVLAEVPHDLRIAGDSPSTRPLPQARNDPSRPTDTLLVFHRQFFFTASRTPTTSSPCVTVHQTLPIGESLLVGSFSSPALVDHLATRPGKPPISVTELRLDDRASLGDEAGKTSRLAVFYSTGQFSIFRLSLPTSTSAFEAKEVYSNLAISTIAPFYSTFDPIVLARFHSPLLATCSRSFVLRFWRIEDGGDEMKVEEIEPSMTSRESWAPVVLTLQKVLTPEEQHQQQEMDEWGMWKAPLADHETDDMFKVTLAYSTPVFPEGWTVGVQEFVVRIPQSYASSLVPVEKHRRPRVTVSTRHAIAPATSHGLFAPARALQQQQLVTAIEHSDPFIVTSRSDNTLDVFEVVSTPLPARLPHSHSTIHLRTDDLTASSKLRVVHRRTLFGHTAGVRSVAIEAGGRCVSGGDDGQVKVWQLGERSMRAVDVVEEEGEAELESEIVAPTVWAQMKAKRARGSRGRAAITPPRQQQEVRPSKIRRLFFDEDKIVSIIEGAGEVESVKVLRFD